MSRRLRIASWLLAALVASATLLYLAGPVYRVDARIAIPPVPPGGLDPDALERALRGSEARFTEDRKSVV